MTARAGIWTGRTVPESGQPRPISPAATGPLPQASRTASALAALACTCVRHGGERIARADRTLVAALPARRSPRGVTFARAVSAVAEPAFAAPLLALAAAMTAQRGGLRAAAVPALAVPAGMVARWLLAELIARPRPPATVWLVEPEGYSLPSRHATLAVLTAGALAAAARETGLHRNAAQVLAGAGVGASRVYLGVHWPSDILAGWLFAMVWLGLLEKVVSHPTPSNFARRRATTSVGR